jgi:hypothetical protein
LRPKKLFSNSFPTFPLERKKVFKNKIQFMRSKKWDAWELQN